MWTSDRLRRTALPLLLLSGVGAWGAGVVYPASRPPSPPEWRRFSTSRLVDWIHIESADAVLWGTSPVRAKIVLNVALRETAVTSNARCPVRACVDGYYNYGVQSLDDSVPIRFDYPLTGGVEWFKRGGGIELPTTAAAIPVNVCWHFDVTSPKVRFLAWFEDGQLRTQPVELALDLTQQLAEHAANGKPAWPMARPAGSMQLPAGPGSNRPAR